MGTVKPPTPVALAGGAICLLAGYLDGVQHQDGVDQDGQLCGTRRSGSGDRQVTVIYGDVLP